MTSAGFSESVEPVQPTPGQASSPLSVHESLRQTKPWVRFLSVLGFICAGLMVLAGIAVGLLSLASGETGMLLIAVVYPISGLLYLVPCLFLSRYATFIGEYLVSGQQAQLEQALQAQKSFWKFVGIVTLVVMCIYLAVFAVMIAVSIVAALL